MAAGATAAAAAAGPSSCRACGVTSWREGRRRKPRPPVLAAPGARSSTATAVAAVGSIVFLLLLLVVRASAQGVLRGATGVAGGGSRRGLEREIGADGVAHDPQAQQGDKGLVSSLFGPSDDAVSAAAAAATHHARLLPLGTYLLHLDVEGHFPQHALSASPFPFVGGVGDRASQLLAATRGMQSGAGTAGPSSQQAQASPRYFLLDTFIRLIFDQRRVAESSPSRHPLLPMCGLVAPIVDTPGFCSMVAFVEARATRGPMSVARASLPGATIYEFEKEPAQNADGSLPLPLADLGSPVPHIVDSAVVEKERHTYYWYLRLVWNLYRYTKRWINATPGGRAGDGSLAPPFVPSGWGHPKIYYANEDDPRGNPPVAQSFIKGNHMAVIIRGTIFNGAVVRDLEYDMTDPGEAESWGIKGFVHDGFLDLASQMFEPLRQEIEAHSEVTRITLTGHSLGGAMAPLICAHLRSRLSPDLVLEYVAFAGPNPGDQTFVDSLDAMPNLRPRRLMYLGSGIKLPKGPYGVGDTVAQTLPPCWALPGCANTYASRTEETFLYAMAGGNVPFYAEDMPGASQWRVKELVLNVTSAPAACHNCSYMCWASKGLNDPEDRCFFRGDPQQPQFPCVYSAFYDIGSDVDPNFGY